MNFLSLTPDDFASQKEPPYGLKLSPLTLDFLKSDLQMLR